MGTLFGPLQDTALTTEREDIPRNFNPKRAVVPIKGVPFRPPVLPKPKTAVAANPSGTGGIPKVLLSVTAVQTPVKQQTYTNCAVTISFTRDTSDTNFDHVNIWFIGYHGSSTPTLMGSGVSSPITLIVDATKENVTVYAQTVSASGQSADYSFATATSVTLTGVAGAAPAPTISQTLTASPLGYQFAFNQVALPAGDIDVVTAYRVYRNTSANTFSGSVLLKTFVHDPTHLGAIVVQDRVGGGVTYYYFVTSVNSAALESGATSAQSGAVVSGTASLDTDVADGATYLRVTATPATGLNTGNAVDSSGNLKLKNVAVGTPTTSGPTTASGTYATIPEMTQTVTTKGNKVALFFSIVLASSVVGYTYAIAFFRDGVMIGPEFDGGNTMTSSNFLQLPFVAIFIDTGASAASHTFDVRWKATAGTVVSVGTQRTFQVVELG
jgi:hypothetical protein